MGIGPVFAIPRPLGRLGLKVDDIDLWEINEAFAVQVIYCRDKRGLDNARLNVSGGAIAVGHPYGVSGQRVAVSMCIGCGMGACGVFEGL